MPGEELISSSLDNWENEKSRSKREEKYHHIGAIDIGTNSTHLLISSVDPALSTFSIELAEKSTTRLGEVDTQSGELTDIAMKRVFDTLSRFKEIASSY